MTLKLLKNSGYTISSSSSHHADYVNVSYSPIYPTPAKMETSLYSNNDIIYQSTPKNKFDLNKQVLNESSVVNSLDYSKHENSNSSIIDIDGINNYKSLFKPIKSCDSDYKPKQPHYVNINVPYKPVKQSSFNNDISINISSNSLR